MNRSGPIDGGLLSPEPQFLVQVLWCDDCHHYCGADCTGARVCKLAHRTMWLKRL
jgi:hypothetical protein